MHFKNGKELLKICNDNNMKIFEVMIKRECKKFNISKKEAINKMIERFETMEKAIEKGIKESNKSFTGLIGGEAKALDEYSKTKSISGPHMINSIKNALATMEQNSKMGKIVAAPTAGSCGILPGVLITTAKEFDIPKKKVINALFTASAIGYIVSRNATVSGAEGGCQAETGTASAMAAAGLVEMFDGTAQQALSAASFTLKNILGLVCDPVAGLVELPCAKRNALGVSNAMICSDMALAGIKTRIPFDQVVESLYRVGKKMNPDLKETANGGIAITEAAKRYEKHIFK
ncbi:MAG: L-serine ammonia-lyase, iron-sulfur-dependent, subunit alpha [Bacillota bacterium]